MKTRRIVGNLVALGLGFVAVTAAATPVLLDTTSPLNGITQIYSATFDGSLAPCTAPGSPSYCAFFGGYPPVSPPAPPRAIVITPTPTGVVQGVPGGIHPPPAAGSFLDLTLSGDHTQVTIAGGTVKIPDLTLTIKSSTFVTAKGAGIAFSNIPQTTSVDANGVAVFTVNTAPAVVVDFSTFTEVVAGTFSGSDGDCTGSLCPLIPVLTLDMIRYRLIIDFDDTFSTFTASFEGQTANNSMLFITMNSGIPNIEITDSAPPATDRQVPFGGVTELTTATRFVTVTNSGSGNVVLGALGQAPPLAAPFALANDFCSGQTLAPGAQCTVEVTFSPTSTGDFPDSFDIPSNDVDEPVITVAVSGTGLALPVPKIAVTDSVAPATDLQVPFGSITEGQTASQTVTVDNNGNADLLLGPVAVTDPPAAPFIVVSDTCSNQPILPAHSCTFGIEFQPTAAGAFDGHIDIPSNDPDALTVTLTVSGTGTPQFVPAITITDDVAPTNDSTADFRNVFVSTTADQTITVTNDGTGNLIIGTVGSANPLAAPFSFAADDCSERTIAPTGTCSISVRFAPEAIDLYSATFDIPSNDPDEETALVTVTGTGGVPEEEPTPEGASSGFMALDPVTLLALGLSGVAVRRRRRTLH